MPRTREQQDLYNAERRQARLDKRLAKQAEKARLEKEKERKEKNKLRHRQARLKAKMSNTNTNNTNNVFTTPVGQGIVPFALAQSPQEQAALQHVASVGKKMEGLELIEKRGQAVANIARAVTEEVMKGYLQTQTADQNFLKEVHGEEHKEAIENLKTVRKSTRKNDDGTGTGADPTAHFTGLATTSMTSPVPATTSGRSPPTRTVEIPSTSVENITSDRRRRSPVNRLVDVVTGHEQVEWVEWRVRKQELAV
jgi:hypothetical protein